MLYFQTLQTIFNISHPPPPEKEWSVTYCSDSVYCKFL